MRVDEYIKVWRGYAMAALQLNSENSVTHCVTQAAEVADAMMALESSRVLDEERSDDENRVML